MTGPTSDPTTPVNRIDTNDPNNPPNLQEQILDHISSLKSLVQLHNESPTGSVKPIQLSFEDEGRPEEKIEEPEDLRKPYKEVLRSPFSRRIIEFTAPNHWTPANLKIYDGSTDPDDHITRFVGAANQGEWEMPVSKIIRKTNETLPDFKERWTEEMSYIPDVLIVMQISSFMSNSKCPELARRFSDQVPKTVTEMMKREDDFVKSEEVFKNTELPRGEFPEKGTTTQFRGSRPPRHSYGSGPSRTNIHPRRDHYQSYVSPRAPDRRYDNRRHDHRRQEVNHLRLDSLTKLPSEILAIELQLQLPPCPPTVAPPKKENLDSSEGGLTRKVMMKFTVVRASSPYNIILGRTGLQELRVVSSTVHAMLKFPTPKGIATLCARIEPVYECRWSDRKIIKQEATKEKAEKHKAPEGEEKVLVNPAFPEQAITIGSQFSAECRELLIRLLKDNMDVFAWQPSDMAGIPKRLIRHTLNVNNFVSPVAQNEKGLGN
ncbi:hypothetical protein Tco_0805427 [Tanacetum coccineum]